MTSSSLSPKTTASVYTSKKYVVQKRPQKHMVMKFDVFEGEVCGGFFGGKLFLAISPRKNSL